MQCLFLFKLLSTVEVTLISTVTKLAVTSCKSDFLCLSVSRDVLPCTCGILPLKRLSSTFLLYEHTVISLRLALLLYKHKSAAMQVPPDTPHHHHPTTTTATTQRQPDLTGGGSVYQTLRRRGDGLALYNVEPSREFIKPCSCYPVLTKGTFGREEAHWPCRRLLSCWCSWL